MPSEDEKFNKLVEINVKEQVFNLIKRLLFKMLGLTGRNYIYMVGYTGLSSRLCD